MHAPRTPQPRPNATYLPDNSRVFVLPFPHSTELLQLTRRVRTRSGTRLQTVIVPRSDVQED